MARESKDWLEDILKAANDVLKFTADMDKAAFDQAVATDRMLSMALSFAFVEVGEAIKSLPDELKRRNAHIDWRSIVGMRDRIVHQYFQTDMDIVWYTIHGPKMRELIVAVESELKAL